MPLKEKHDQIMAWIDLPLERRPQLIMGEPSPRSLQANAKHYFQLTNRRSTKLVTWQDPSPSSWTYVTHLP